MKINLHMIDYCNFKCRYCFAHFEKHETLSEEDWRKIIKNCADSGLIDEINFAGGEPLLSLDLTRLAAYAKSQGLKTGVITNGLLLNRAWAGNFGKHFDTIGVSLDSFNPNTMRKIGRRWNEHDLDIDNLEDVLKFIKSTYPGMKIKLNTVVNRYNKNENLAKNIISRGLPIGRWKLLECKPFDDGVHSNNRLCVSDGDYAKFAAKQLEAFNLEYSPDISRYIADSGLEIIAEKEMRAGYIMADSGGYLVDNARNSSYERVADLRSIDFKAAFEKLTFDRSLYEARYEK